MEQQTAGTAKAKRWALRGAAIAVAVVPMLTLSLAGSASAAELTPIAEYLDATVASTSASLVHALAILLGV